MLEAILIVYYFAATAGGVTSIHFKSLKACEQAAAVIRAIPTTLNVTCVADF